MHGGEQQAGGEREMGHEGAELGLVAGPVRRTVEGKPRKTT
ncbi:hypothetical protein X733_04375 [Mesorhizobium sp. L2C067A000]|nr:hypothetical protein X733_04375 [Mesorhizobium sp. L2C067A000]